MASCYFLPRSVLTVPTLESSFRYGQIDQTTSSNETSLLTPSRSPNAPVFALGGLAGGNGFGAGFLEAVRQHGIRPVAISCTSGMIMWTARFLAGEDLREHFHREVAATPVGQGVPAPVASALVGMTGLQGVFRPAMQEYWRRWFEPPAELSLQVLVDRLLPTQTACSTRPDSFFEDMADVLNDSDIAVMFNAFSPPQGIEYLFMNPAAMRLFGRNHNQISGQQTTQNIDAEAVRAALHLYAYGHEDDYGGRHLIDGAYHRQFILDELCSLAAQGELSDLWMVRPQNSRWSGQMPSNYFDQRDMETAISMNSSYMSQLRRIELINRLLEQGQLNGAQYHPIALRLFEYEGHRGYFGYFNESRDVFEQGFNRAMQALD